MSVKSLVVSYDPNARQLIAANDQEKGEMNAGAEKSEMVFSPERSKKGKTQQRFTPEEESERRAYI